MEPLLAQEIESLHPQRVATGRAGVSFGATMQVAYRAAYEPEHPQRNAMLEDFRDTVLRLWPLEDLTDLGVSPTSYLDDDHAFAFLPFGASTVPQQTARRRLMNGLILPMLYEDDEWRIDLPGWRFLDS